MLENPIKYQLFLFVFTQFFNVAFKISLEND